MWVASKDCFQLVDSPMFWNFSKFPVNNRVPANNPVFTKTGIARFWNIKSNIAAHQNSRVDPGNLLVPSMTWNSGPFKIRFFRYCSSTTTVVQRLFRVIWHNWRLWPNHWELRNFLHMAFKDEGQSYISVKSQLEITDPSWIVHQFSRVRILLWHTVLCISNYRILSNYNPYSN